MTFGSLVTITTRLIAPRPCFPHKQAEKQERRVEYVDAPEVLNEEFSLLSDQDRDDCEIIGSALLTLINGSSVGVAIKWILCRLSPTLCATILRAAERRKLIMDDRFDSFREGGRR